MTTSHPSVDLHREVVIIDAVCPLVSDDPRYIDLYRAGGTSVVGPSVGGNHGARVTINQLALWHRLFREDETLLLVRSASDIEEAKETGRLGVFLHFQGPEPIEDNLDLIDLYKSLGVGIIQIAYNVRNRFGDGIEELSDAGLSKFGQRLVERLNKSKVIVDCSHTGLRTTLDTIACSSAPVVLSHSNATWVYPSGRNVPTEIVDAIAASGGIVGIAGFPAMISSAPRPHLDDFLDHIDAIVQRAGIDFVGLGIDYYSGQAGIATDEAALEFYRRAVAEGLWGAAYPPPPHHYPIGIETPEKLQNLTAGLVDRGYSATDVAKIMGANWLRVMRAVWG